MELREDDLFTLASSLAELLGAPVTIEDTDTAVLAYSGGAQAVDDARVGTILGRQVPSHYRQLLDEAGVFERLRTDTGVIYVDLASTRMTPRAVIAVRDGDAVIGAIWAAVACAPTAAQESVLRSAVPVVARRMVLERDRADVAHRTSAERVDLLLTGGLPGAKVADELGMRGALTVAAIGPAAATGAPARLLASMALHLDALAVRAVFAQPDDVAYAVIGAQEADVRRILHDYIARARAPIVIGIGRTVDSARDVPRSRADADLVLGALRHAGSAGVVAGLPESLAAVLALQLADTFAELDALSPLTAMARFDREHGSELVASAYAYLEHGGDIADAAAALHVHPNTLRNRLRRATDCGVHLDDPDTRLVLMLHLKLRALGRP